ncbi:hypothetical protein L3Q72_18025 [Vibrio sp. JC009]|uniref:hypothetical protein n=1 Tax=Vibrio sp. JC009 TaxID=2912314 RepID=UPI0023AFFA42|nr:hypothetical protein [Vibrio sp. JC009]WED24774.1 hypothetical protein L3Q72_18025 [Vibrio sp. JC009]
MKKICPIALAISAALSQGAVASEFFADSTVDVKWKVNYYDIEGEVDSVAPAGDLFNMEPGAVDGVVNYDMSIKDAGTSVWVNWQSGWIADTIGVEMEFQGAYLFDQSGTISGSASAMGVDVPLQADNPYFYGKDADEDAIGKIGNANLRFKTGSKEKETQLIIGRFTPTIYDLLHRPDEIYYGMHQVYEGVNIEGHYEWSRGMIEPWVRYMTGYSNEWNESTVRFKDLDDVYYDSYGNAQYGYDEIINLGFHTVNDFLTSSASYSYAEDYLSNGIIEIYSGIPYSLLGWGSEEGDKDHFIKYMVKYGFEKGLGDNDAHETDVYEFAVGLQHGDLDFLVGVTQNGDESFYGFETQDGMNAGGGTAVWGDVAILNTFKLAGQRTYFLTGGINLDGINLPNWRVQGVIANANDTDLEALRFDDRINTPNEDYTEINLDIVYAKNGYQGEGMSYVLKLGKDDNFNAFGFGLFVEYNGDVTKLMD